MENHVLAVLLLMMPLFSSLMYEVYGKFNIVAIV